MLNYFSGKEALGLRSLCQQVTANFIMNVYDLTDNKTNIFCKGYPLLISILVQFRSLHLLILLEYSGCFFFSLSLTFALFMLLLFQTYQICWFFKAFYFFDISIDFLQSMAVVLKFLVGDSEEVQNRAYLVCLHV